MSEDLLNVDPVGKNLPETAMIHDALQTGFKNPYGAEKSGFDVLGAGPSDQLGIGLDPNKAGDRQIGRTVGTVAATYGAGSALGAGAGAGAEGAAGGAAGGTGITPGAAGASGISAGAGGASGISAGGAAGTALAPGFFASEGSSLLPGTTDAAAGGAGSILPEQTPAAPGATAGGAPAGGAAGGTGITPPPTSGTPGVSGLQVGSGGAPTGAAGVEAPGVVPKAAPSFVDKAMTSIKANPLPAASLGLNIFSQINANKANRSAQDALNRNAQPVSDASKQLLQQGLSGQVPTAIMQQYQSSFNDRVGEIKQRFANMGRDPNTDSAAQAEIAKAKQEMDAQVANYASSLVNQGLQAAGVASGPQTQAVIAGMQQDKDLQQALSGSLNSLALLQSLQRNQQPAAAAPAQ